MLAVLGWMLGSLAWAGVTVSLPASDAEVVFEDDSRAAVEQAMQAMAAGRYDAAGRAFRALAEAGGGADARLLEAGAWYEGGQVRLAEKAVQRVLSADPDRGPALSLYGLILADTGRGEQALPVLDRAAARARARGDARLQVRVALNRGLVHLDRGELSRGREVVEAARTQAVALGDDDLIAAAEASLATLAATAGEGGGGDPVSAVTARLRAGDLDGARAAVPEPPEHDRRAGVRALLADALIDRAAGAFDQANLKLRTALGLAREGGLVRETSAILAEIGVLYGLAGRFDMALDALQEAVGLLAGTSFRLREVAARVEAGRVAIRLGDQQQARNQLAAAAVVAEQTEDPLGTARISELRGQLAAAADQPEAATAHYEAARAAYLERDHHADAARIATDLVRVWAGRDEAATRRWTKAAEQAFARVGNTAGPAHVRVAAGLGYARRGDLDRALASFVDAAERAEATDTARGRQIAAHARENAAQALKALGHTDDLADEMAQATRLEGVMARQEAFSAAEARYDAARAAFDRGDYSSALQGFDLAVSAFRNLDEEGYAGTARRGRGWAGRNLALRLEPEAAIPVFRRAAADGQAVGDAELHAKALVGLGLASKEGDTRDAVERLTEAADVAERVGLDDEAGLCFAAIAEAAEDLDVRAAAARRALDLRGVDDADAIYAMYSVAVDAYNAGAHDLALALADEIAPHAGNLAEAVASVREAARQAREPRD